MKPDSKSKNNSDSILANRSSQELVELWHRGSHEAARVLLARYQVRLVALVAARLSKKFRDSIDPEDVVQSAMGSFFRVTGAGAKPSIKLESTASAWNLLATFTRRKLARNLERESALKRGGRQTRLSLEQVMPDLLSEPTTAAADEILEGVQELLNAEQSQLLEQLLENRTQREIADLLGVDERTIRRRIAAIKEILAGRAFSSEHLYIPHIPSSDARGSISLPNISYRQFVLGKLIGSGALGKVYLARMQADGQVVAVKFMHRHLWSSRESGDSFLREIDQASKVNHPSVIKYHGWGQSPHGGPYLVSDYVDGQPLAKLRPNDASLCVGWLVQICEAISATHIAGVIHGDLTPNNILVDTAGRVVLIDFGFARHATQRNQEAAETDSIAALGGTLGFAAPEQISPAYGEVGIATDIYAIGGLAFYLLTGRAPHDGAGIWETLADSDVVIPDTHCTADQHKLQHKLASVARLALKKAVQSRPGSVSELLALLRE
ncbi:protein kinase domain-containing protein [Pirellulaceae bacterium SH449]